MKTKPTVPAEKLRASPMVDWVVPSGAVDIVLDELKVKLRRKRARRNRIAGACAALMLVGAMLWQSTPVDAPAAASTTLRISAPQRQVLDDGSIVELREGAAVQAHFTAARRSVDLQSGEAHFQVSKDAARPFVVRANGVEFRAVGTAFSVVLNAQQVELLVTEGTVAVDQVSVGEAASHDGAPDAAAQSRTAGILVTAGNRVLVATPAEAGPRLTPAAEPVPSESVAARLSWRVPRVEFTRAKLSEVIKSFQQHAGVEIELSEQSLADLELSGVLRADNVHSLLQLLETEFQIVALRDGKRIRLVR